jgi:hypothetical protein
VHYTYAGAHIKANEGTDESSDEEAYEISHVATHVKAYQGANKPTNVKAYQVSDITDGKLVV